MPNEQFQQTSVHFEYFPRKLNIQTYVIDVYIYIWPTKSVKVLRWSDEKLANNFIASFIFYLLQWRWIDSLKRATDFDLIRKPKFVRSTNYYCSKIASRIANFELNANAIDRFNPKNKPTHLVGSFAFIWDVVKPVIVDEVTNEISRKREKKIMCLLFLFGDDDDQRKRIHSNTMFSYMSDSHRLFTEWYILSFVRSNTVVGIVVVCIKFCVCERIKRATLDITLFVRAQFGSVYFRCVVYVIKLQVLTWN